MNRVRRSVNVATDAQSFQHLRIDQDSLQNYSHAIRRELSNEPGWNDQKYPTLFDFSEDTLFDFILIGNSMNFAFDDFQTQQTFSVHYNGRTYTGAYAMWACLNRAVESGLDITDGFVLRDLSYEQAEGIFEGKTPIPMLDSRVEVLRHIGNQLCKIAHGRAHTLFNPTEPMQLYDDGDGFVEYLTAIFPKAFKDERTWRGRRVYFDKKAQLVAGMVHSLFRATDLYTFTDIEEMTILADYVIPALFHHEGILRYNHSIAEMVEFSSQIPENGEREIEIRAATVLIGEKLLRRVNGGYETPIGGFTLDQVMWRLGRDMDLSHHFTRTTCY
jgi:hypothetical protein